MGNQFQLHRRKKIRVNGFVIDASNITLAKWIFQTYPETTDNVKVQNQSLRNTYMNLLCRTIGILYHTPLGYLTEAELTKASKDLHDLTQVGFKLDWLNSKFDKVSSEKKTSEERIVELKLEVKKLVMTVSDLKVERKNEKKKLKKQPSWIHLA
ncbi:PREDICTED: MATH domain and coiled-coil domain-containing protein At2g42465-like [Camelina sativa]|uniref:MATH domain and coiled-coil domain-containing protein At2g42465-like n=1 Tax=Camelina sativa TaxID=90675 RepID=A0ABM1QT93_CAMSA|nr:PREDICTED: MATH domain and coiled-coil domain-containing protein At2g42465-like [Camelina sativa]